MCRGKDCIKIKIDDSDSTMPKYRILMKQSNTKTPILYEYAIDGYHSYELQAIVVSKNQKHFYAYVKQEKWTFLDDTEVRGLEFSHI